MEPKAASAIKRGDRLRAYPKTSSGSRGGFRPSPETAEIHDEFRYDIARSSMIEWVIG
ncbi:MAG: hypothetical protein GY904_02195 [Planctomycetaceae bacterium]|nr:hypothetical protein [Planctomycetaceae bacterium]